MRCLGDRDYKVAAGAAITLGRLRLEPQLVVPALERNLSSTNLAIRNCSALALGEYGENAKSALPDLLLLLHDPIEKIRTTATNSITRIAPTLLQER